MRGKDGYSNGGGGRRSINIRSGSSSISRSRRRRKSAKAAAVFGLTTTLVYIIIKALLHIVVSGGAARNSLYTYFPSLHVTTSNIYFILTRDALVCLLTLPPMPLRNLIFFFRLLFPSSSASSFFVLSFFRRFYLFLLLNFTNQPFGCVCLPATRLLACLPACAPTFSSSRADDADGSCSKVQQRGGVAWRGAKIDGHMHLHRRRAFAFAT